MSKEYNKDKIENIRKKSTSLGTTKKTGHKMNITREEYLRRLFVTIGLTSAVTAFTIGGGKLLKDKINNSVTIGTTKNTYYHDLVDPNWHPTDEGGAIWYDEGSIASDLKSLNENEEYGYEFDVGISTLLDHIGEEETNTVLRYTEYGGLDEYLDQKGYDNIDTFQENIDKQIITKSNLDEKQKELDEMRNEANKEVAQSNETAKVGER